MAGLPPNELEVRSFHVDLVDDLARLFASDQSASNCWCMWFIDSVKDFHAAGPAGNRARFLSLAGSTAEPLGLLAYFAHEPVGWCAVGPKERYERAMRTPTLLGFVAPEEPTWFVPCFFVHPKHRRGGVTKPLLERATSLAFENGAQLVLGFPASGSRPASSGDRQVGSEGVFASQGYQPVHRPSTNRVIMQVAVRGTASGA